MKQRESVSFTMRKPDEAERDYDQLSKIWNFLQDAGELSFDPPFVARPPSGKKAHVARALYLMAAGLEALEAKYPKRKGASVSFPLSSDKSDESDVQF
jgi:hypothetical protein